MVVKKFQIHGVKITVKYIFESKNWMFFFTNAYCADNTPPSPI